ncbi:hypothetical protein BNJ_00403 [Kaumoebavirus]|uniref:hypothetical protein n=1 Tax=Kaumoebavirus TaxID=1859492 RepID=UPI0009C2AB93|nr:hypothetical protein BNJ_00403 [Kaumoebavirus]ARA72221.1 hypothetical protein BNJ_00403 [Kaumoebavirus]
MINIIALCGKEGSGKSTAARYLAKHHGFTLLNFSDPIKKMANCLGYPMAVLEPQTEEAREMRENYVNSITEKTGRQMLLILGKALRENCTDKIYVNYLLDRLEPGNTYVIADLRYPLEIEALMDRSRFTTLFIEVLEEIDGEYPHDWFVDYVSENTRREYPAYTNAFVKAVNEHRGTFARNRKNEEFFEQLKHYAELLRNGAYDEKPDVIDNESATY